MIDPLHRTDYVGCGYSIEQFRPFPPIDLIDRAEEEEAIADAVDSFICSKETQSGEFDFET